VARLDPHPRSQEKNPRQPLLGKLRSELEYIRLVRPAVFARAVVADTCDAILRRRHPLTPPRRLGFVGNGDFRTSGDAFRELFVSLGDLRPDEDVLDVGSGIGRAVIGLTGWLQGRYEGIDVVRRGIEWYQWAITPRYPNFQFQVADVYNRLAYEEANVNPQVEHNGLQMRAVQYGPGPGVATGSGGKTSS
jgi:SAM-dependent methyltransferase